MRAFTTAIVAVLAAVPSVQAWWDNGHMLVGEVASQLMAKQDRKTIQKVLRDWEKDFPNTDRIATAAVWPDMVKCAKNSTSCSTALLPSFSAFDNWHYMNLPMNANATQWGSAPPDLSLFKKSLGGNAVNVFDTFLSTFNTTKSLWSANLALRQLIHIVADVHQPLHAVGAVSEKYPGGDTGGNLYTFKMPCRSTNLHALYDAAGGELTNYWALKMDATNAMLKKNATQLISTIPSLKDTLDFSGLMAMPYPQFSAAFVSGSYFKKMVFESYEIANAVVYPGINTTFDGNNVDCPSPSYFTQATALSKERITLAGKRLAVLLTKIAQHFRATKLV